MRFGSRLASPLLTYRPVVADRYLTGTGLGGFVGFGFFAIREDGWAAIHPSRPHRLPSYFRSVSFTVVFGCFLA